MVTKKKQNKSTKEDNLGFDDISELIEDKIKDIKKRTSIEELTFRLTSRKFWLTIAVCGYFMWRGLNSSDTVAILGYLTQVVISFLAIQGGVDALAKIAEARATKQMPEPDYSGTGELDPNVINAAANVRFSNPSAQVPPGD